MAIINCPECNKEISDTCKKCGYCGFKLKKSNKKLIIGVIIFVAILIIGILTYLVIKNYNIKKYEEEYNQLILETTSNMRIYKQLTDLHGAYITEIWYNSIFEKSDTYTDKYTKKYIGQYFSGYVDFSTAINNYITENKDSIENLYNYKMEVSSNIQKLKDCPNQKYKEAHDKLVNMYSTISVLIDLVKSPTGNYSSYSNKFHEYSEEFDSLYEEFRILLPEIDTIQTKEKDKIDDK